MIFKPVEFKVLIKPDKVDDLYAGKIIIPDIAKDKQQISQDKGEIIGMGGNACEDWNAPIPKIGDRVLMNRHAGYTFFDDSEGKRTEYRVINDKDITMILEAENGT